MYIPRYTIELKRDGSLQADARKITCSDNLRNLFATLMLKRDRETFYVLTLDRKNKVIGANLVAVGSVSSAVVHPREVFKLAILQNAAAIAVGHNHPSGDCLPSAEDRGLTSRLVTSGRILGIQVLDHIILGDGTGLYYSFADEGTLDTDRSISG